MAVFHISRTWLNALNCAEPIEYSLKRNPVTAVLGPRPCGKTALARKALFHQIVAANVSWR